MGRALIIAEAGVNHNGSLELACRMADVAKEAGADIVKFQTGIPENIVSKHAPKAPYQGRATGEGEGQLGMLRRLMLSFGEFEVLKHHCGSTGIGFLSTPFDISSIHFLDRIGCSMWKIPSGEITDYPYLVQVAATGKPAILSTGMSTMEEIAAAIEVLSSHGCGEITLLHCTTEYPAPIGEVNLNAMLTLRDAFGCKVGYSDHTEGIEVAVAAAALGASVIEKHFTLGRGMDGPDHKASLEPRELAGMVRAIRRVEQALGNSRKAPTPSEIQNMPAARRSIVAARDIRQGELLSGDNLAAKRPGGGISPMEWEKVAGTRAVRDFRQDEMIEL